MTYNEWLNEVVEIIKSKLSLTVGFTSLGSMVLTMPKFDWRMRVEREWFEREYCGGETNPKSAAYYIISFAKDEWWKLIVR